MKKLKYVIMIIVLCLIVFIGVEVFKNDKREEEKKEENTNTIIEENQEKIENDNKEKEEENNIQSNTENNTQTNNIKGEIKSGTKGRKNFNSERLDGSIKQYDRTKRRSIIFI